MLADHRLYQETEYHQGHRANFSSADLAGRDFSGLNLRGGKMDRAVLRGSQFHRSPSAKRELGRRDLAEAFVDRTDLSRAFKWGKARFGQSRDRSYEMSSPRSAGVPRRRDSST